MSDKFAINTDPVSVAGKAIIDSAQELIQVDMPGLDDFQRTFNTIKQQNFPDKLQDALGQFITSFYNGYTQNVLQNREVIGWLLQNKVAYEGDVKEYMTEQQFKIQMTEIKQLQKSKNP